MRTFESMRKKKEIRESNKFMIHDINFIDRMRKRNKYS